MTYTFYSPESRQWVELTDAEAQTPEAQKYHPVPLDNSARGVVRNSYGLRPVRGAMPDMLEGNSSLSAYRTPDQEALPQGSAGAEALPFRIKQGGSFANIHAARAYKDANPRSGEIEVRVYDPTERQNMLWSFKPLSEIEQRKGDKNIIATMGETGLGFPVYRSVDEGIKKQVDQKVAQGGFGTVDTAKVVASNFVKGLSPFDVSDAIPSVRNLTDVNRAYNQVEQDAQGNPYNADPGYMRTGFTTVLPAIAGGFAGGGLAGRVKNPTGRLGTDALVNPSSVAIDAVKYGAKSLPEVIKRKAAASIPGRFIGGVSEIPLIRSVAGGVKPLLKGAATGLGDMAISDLVADKVRDEETPFDPRRYIISGGLSTLASIPAAVLGVKRANFTNKLDDAIRYDQDMRDKVKGDPNTKEMYDNYSQSVTDASKLDLPGETPLRPAEPMVDAKGRPVQREMDFFEQEGVHRPEVVKTRLADYNKKIENIEADINQRAENEIPQLQAGLRRTIPEYTGAATEKQKNSYSKEADEYGVTSSFVDPRDAVYDYARNLISELTSKGILRRDQAIAQVFGHLQDKGLIKDNGITVEDFTRAVDDQKWFGEVAYLPDPGKGVLPPRVPSNAAVPSGYMPATGAISQPPLPMNPVNVPSGAAPNQMSIAPRRLQPAMSSTGRQAKPVPGLQGTMGKLASKVAAKNQTSFSPVPTMSGNLAGSSQPLPSVPRQYAQSQQASTQMPFPGSQPAPYAAQMPTPVKTYGEHDFTTYGSIHDENYGGNAAYAQAQNQRPASMQLSDQEAIRRASRATLVTSFGDDFSIPQEAKKLALDVQDAIIQPLGYEKGTPSHEIKLDIAEHAPKLVNMIRATMAMGQKAAGDIEKGNIQARDLQRNQFNLQAAGSGFLREGIDTHSQKTPTDTSPSDNLYKFNQETRDFFEVMTSLIKRSESLKNAESYLELKKIVDDKWAILEKLTKDVTANDLNDMGRLMREYVIWNQFVSNVPGLGGIGKLISSIQMLSQSGAILARDKTHIATSKLDSIWIAKHAQTLMGKFQKDLQRISEELEKSTRLWNLRNVGRTATSGFERGEDTKEHRLPKDLQDIVDLMQSEYQKDIQAKKQSQATQTPTPQSNVERVFNAILSAPIDQQEKLYDDAIASGQLTETEIEELNGKIQQSGD